MDELKKYLLAHRSEMDVDMPPGKVWKGIAQVTTKKSRPLLHLSAKMVTAACLVTLLCFGIKWMAFNEKKAERIALADNLLQNIKNAVNANRQDMVKVAPRIPRQPLQKEIKPDNKQKAAVLLNDLQSTYSLIVKMQLNQVRNTPVLGEDANYFAAFKTMLDQMDNEETIIRKNITRQGITTKLLETLINIYQLKLDILKNLQIEIKKMNDVIKNNDPAADSIKAFYLNI